ncbi:hypothetical protein K402DRAFT_390905 [Aulographum hederae CBS 113979]|uniref:Rab-GAP TBC domain-containing protein n=1 Tax=Aulographum hederae CBS 113979 TaxID=1176131 RepID=A0A6G1H8C8_9PEZI|nr:hypothetical protein K402DRAFT_390905 [Aulographum hederae CBS 113979]
MDTLSSMPMRRNSSHQSNHSSRKGGTARGKPKRAPSTTSTDQNYTPSERSLTSFPSLSSSVDASPPTPRQGSIQSARFSSVSRGNSSDGGRRFETVRKRPPLSIGGLDGAEDRDLEAALEENVRRTSVASLPRISQAGRNRSTKGLFDNLLSRTPVKDKTPLFEEVENAEDIPGNLHLASDAHLKHVRRRVGADNLIRQLSRDLAARDHEVSLLRRKITELESEKERSSSSSFPVQPSMALDGLRTDVRGPFLELDTQLESLRKVSSNPSPRTTRHDGSKVISPQDVSPATVSPVVTELRRQSTKPGQAVNAGIDRVQNVTRGRSTSNPQTRVEKIRRRNPPHVKKDSLNRVVELNKIVPFEDLPPALEPNHSYDATSQLTDRFGFFFIDRNNSSHRNSGLVGEAWPDQRVTADDSSSVHSMGLDGRPSSASESVTSEKEKTKWYDWLKPAKYRPSILSAELLLNTPLPAPLEISRGLLTSAMSPKAETPPAVNQDKAQLIVSPSTNPIPSTTRIFARYAEFTGTTKKRPRSINSIASAQTTASSGQSTANATKDALKSSLLKQMNELHDSIQERKRVKWNQLAIKIRAQQSRKLEAAAAKELQKKLTSSSPPHHPSYSPSHLSPITTPREALPELLQANGDLNEYAPLLLNPHNKDFAQLVFEGLPVDRRARIWLARAALYESPIPGAYAELVDSSLAQSDPDAGNVWMKEVAGDIDRDVARTMDENRFFRTPGPGRVKLREVLLAFAFKYPRIGYVQGMNLITAYLLLITTTNEDAFLLLEHLITRIMPRGYYESGFRASRADARVLRSFVKDKLPKLDERLDALEAGDVFELVGFGWFLSLFTNLLSAEALYRVWDVIFCLPGPPTSPTHSSFNIENSGTNIGNSNSNGNAETSNTTDPIPSPTVPAASSNVPYLGSSPFLHPVALSLLKLNEPQLLAAETREELSERLSKGMTGHVLGLDNLMKGCWEVGRGFAGGGEVEGRRWGEMSTF